MKFNFIMPVWGKSYIDQFFSIGLPSQLSSGNLGSFPFSGESRYLIYTKSEDANRIRNERLFQQLAKIIHTEIIELDKIARDKYRMMNACHMHAFSNAPEGTNFVFVLPDHIWADGTFRNMVPILEQGKRAIMVLTLRVARERFVPDLLESCTVKDGILSISQKSLCELTLKNLHPISNGLFWDSEHFSLWPSHLYWRTDTGGMYLRGFHLHPLVIRPIKNNILIREAIDADYILNACPDFKEIFVVQDSGSIFGSEVSEESYEFMFPEGIHHARVWDVASWSRKFAHKHHADFFRSPIVFGDSDTPDLRKRADSIARRILLYRNFLLLVWVPLAIIGSLAVLPVIPFKFQWGADRLFSNLRFLYDFIQYLPGGYRIQNFMMFLYCKIFPGRPSCGNC